MRKLPLLLALLLLGLLGTAAIASATPLPTIQPAPLLTLEDEEGEAEETEDEEAEDAAEEAQIERELCEEDPDFCEEEESERNEGKGKKSDECLLKKASATVIANPGKRRLQLTVAYKTLKPATVNVEAGLRGAKGALSLGNKHTRLRRSGVYRDTFQLPEKKMEKALAARDFQVELHVVNTPPSCRVEVTARRDGAKKLSWS